MGLPPVRRGTHAEILDGLKRLSARPVPTDARPGDQLGGVDVPRVRAWLRTVWFRPTFLSPNGRMPR